MIILHMHIIIADMEIGIYDGLLNFRLYLAKGLKKKLGQGKLKYAHHR